jgi:hypothetical protein
MNGSAVFVCWYQIFVLLAGISPRSSSFSSLQALQICFNSKTSDNLAIMKFFALLPLASLFLGALSSPVSSVALQQRAADPVTTLQQFTTDSKQYTDAIR